MDMFMKKITKEEAIELTKNNYIKIIVKDCTNQKKFDTFLESMLLYSKNNYKIEVIRADEIVEDINLSKLEENICQNSQPIEIINSYMEEMVFENGIEKDILKSIFDDLYKEAKLLKE